MGKFDYKKSTFESNSDDVVSNDNSSGDDVESGAEAFDYNTAFIRNIGLVSEEEQTALRNKRIAIAGMGGVGGSHLLTLIRMGFQNFHISDMDHFELVNFNRQAGAKMENIGKHKADAMKEMAMEINPEANIEVFGQGINDENMDEFLEGVDLYLDGLDFFVLDIRARLFEKCRNKGIFAITAGPVGLSTAYLVFDPKGVGFEEYFQIEGKSRSRKAANFLIGLTPKALQKNHVVDWTYVDFKEGRGPSMASSCMACSAVIAMEAFKILLGRGKTYSAPWACQFDMYNNKFIKTYNWLGNKHPLNKIKINILMKRLT